MTSTPTCPACGATFSHSKETMQCMKCGLPDETVAAGPRAVAKWKKRHGFVKQRAASLSRRRKKHGRQVQTH